MKAVDLFHGYLLRTISALLFYTFSFYQTSDIAAQDCFPNGLTFSNQNQIDNFERDFPGCTIINGDLIIEGNDIRSLESLRSIIIVRGSLMVQHCNQLESLKGLEIFTIERSILINNNLLLNSLDGLDNVNGEVFGVSINDNPAIQKIGFLDNITSMNRFFIYNNPALQSINTFQNLIEVNESFNIFNNPLLVNLQGFNKNLNIQGDLTISNNIQLSDCDARFLCNYLKSPTGVINIANNRTGCNTINEIRLSCPVACLPNGITFTRQSQLDSFRILFPDCDEILGSITISGNDIRDVSPLENIRIVHKNLIIIDNPILEFVKTFDNLKIVGDELKIENNSKLKLLRFITLDSVGFRFSIKDNPLDFKCDFPKLKFIGENLFISNNGLSNLDLGFSNLSRIENHFILSSNSNLVSLKSFDHNIKLNGNLEIVGNVELNDCNLLVFCNFIKLHSGSSRVIIENNKIGCNSENQILSSCNGCCLPNGITFTKQTEIDNFKINYPGCNCIEGNLEIIDHRPNSIDPIKYIEGLSVITKIVGHLLFSADSLLNFDGFSNLKSIGGLTIRSCKNITTLSGFSSLLNIGNVGIGYSIGINIEYNPKLIDLNALWKAKYNGRVNITNNISLHSLIGIQNFDWSNSRLSLSYNPSLLDLKDFIGVKSMHSLYLGNLNLKNINGLDNIESILNLAIIFNNNLTRIDGINKITYIERLSISRNHLLQDINGFNSLQYIDGGLQIYQNSSLLKLNGFRKLESILFSDDSDYFDGTLYIEGNQSLEMIEGFDKLNYIEELYLNNNDNLTQTNAFNKNIDMGRLTVSSNRSLSDCSIVSFCNMAINFPTSTFITNNSPGCNSVQEVQDACNRRQFRNQFVVSEGASHMTGSGTLLRATLGQPIINLVQSPEIQNSQGFWYPIRNVLISKDVVVELDQVSCILYPNPVSGEAVLEISGVLPGSLKIELLDINGKIHRVWDKNVDDPHQFKIPLDLSNVPQGSYVLRLKSDKKLWNSKLIKSE